jgi:hypothetical protein
MNEMNETEAEQEDVFDAELTTAKPPAESRSAGSCCLFGCLFAMLLMAVLTVGGGFVAYRFYQGQLAKYTSASPAVLPTVEFSEEELADIEARIKTFKTSVEEGESPEDLVLTAEEINALIAKDEDLRGRVYITIEDGQVSGDVSIPIGGLPGGKGRYFNASAAFDVSLEGGVLIVTLDDAKVKDNPVPREIIDSISRENLAKEIYKNPEVAEMLSRFDSLIIEDDKIILKPRIKPKTAPVEVDAEVTEAAMSDVPELEVIQN